MISRLLFDQAQIQKDQSFLMRKNQTYNNNEQCSKKMLKDCVYSIDQGVQVLYTLILLFLLELASHSVPLILFSNNDFAHSPVKVLTLVFSLFLSRHTIIHVQLSFTSFCSPYARRLITKTLQWFIQKWERCSPRNI